MPHLTFLYRKSAVKPLDLSKAKKVHSHVLQVAVEDLDKAFQAFFNRVKAKEEAGYPRFKSGKRWHSIGFKQYGNGFKVAGRRLRISGVGRIHVRWHRPYEGQIKTCRVLRKAGRWYVSLACDVPEFVALPETGRVIGLDMGINALITDDKGEQVDNPRWYRQGQTELRLKQRKLARAQRGSNHRQKKLLSVQRQHEHIKNQRKDFFDKLVYELIQNYDVIAIEDLKIKNMVKNHRLSKSILDAGWGYFKQRLLDKAAEAGREVVLVNPAYTSKKCSNCGCEFENFNLSVRWVTCNKCGLSLDRDHNAALNILDRALKILKRAGRVREPERSGS
ncbi:MAG: transposase [Anaerolineae bacterium]|nr:transposase [Anaerolineae bacterium]MDQ7034285.1 transposase [Anaerolineae bacterium]